MVYSLTWMADVLRRAGLQVREIPGWQNRGHGDVDRIAGVMMHHTAGPAMGDFPSQDVVVNGRPGLPGPLCNLGLTRSGVCVVVAAGQAYHAGAGYWAPIGRDAGNRRTIGIEAESTGRGDWTEAQHIAYPRMVAALLLHFGFGPDRAVAHKEYTNRKIDPAGWRWGDMRGFRTDVAYQQTEIRAGRTSGSGAPVPASGEDFLMALPDWQQQRIYDRVLMMSQGVSGQNFDGEQFAAEKAWRAQADSKLDALLGLLAQATEGDLTEEKAAEIINRAVTGQTAALSEAISAQLTARVLPELTGILETALGEDNEEQAREIVRQLGEALSRSPRVDDDSDQA